MRLLAPLHLRLLRYLRRYLFPHIAVLALAMLVLSVTNGVTPFLVRGFINQLALKNLAALRIVSLEILALFLLRAISNFGDDYLGSYIGQKLTLDMRSELNDRLQRLPLSFFNRTATGVILARVLSDVGLAVGAVTDGVFSIVGDGATLVALVVGAFYLDWRYALIGFVVFPAAVLPIAWFSKQMRRMTKDAQRQVGGLVSLLQETFQGNRVVKAFGMEDYERRRFNTELRRLLRISMRVARIKAFTSPMIEVMGAFALVTVLWLGASSVLRGGRDAGSFGAFGAALLLVYQPFKRLSKTNNTIQQGLAGAERVFAMMDEPTDVPDAPNAVPLGRGPHSIEFSHAGFRYGDDPPVLHDINLKIGAGEVVALVGMSGGGKSTLADLIPRFYDVQEGRITVDGIDLRKIKLSSLRAQIGVVTQHTFLFNDTIRANIAYGSISKAMDEIIVAAKLANAHDFVTRLPNGYDTVVGEFGVRLSGGERQRIAIARALLKNAPILILDEATSSLDSEAERQVQEALEHLMENRTTLVIAHRLSTVRRAERIAVIVHGRIVEEGTHEQLFALGREYRKLYDLQFVSAEELAPDGELLNQT
ncbi:MAG: ABC transporter ATP-binding protein [Candidatus Binataceae bacterium]